MTLVHPRVIVFAGHCGSGHERVFFGQRFEIALDLDAGSATLPHAEQYTSLRLSRCDIHPEAAIGSGSDVAFCELADAVADTQTVPLLAGCERERLRAGGQATLVGFGFDTLDQGHPGTKRVARTRIGGVSTELFIGDEGVGTCPGDSGGPAFVRVDADLQRADWRLAGVLSSGVAGRCGRGRYTDVAHVVQWIEAASGYDLTPCHDENQRWSPGSACLIPPLNADGEPTGQSEGPSTACSQQRASASCAVSVIGSQQVRAR